MVETWRESGGPEATGRTTGQKMYGPAMSARKRKKERQRGGDGERVKERDLSRPEQKEDRECNGSEKQSETYELILIGGDSGEYGLREYEGLVRLLLEVHDLLRRARVRPFHQVDPRLVLVHGVQHQLQIVSVYCRL